MADHTFTSHDARMGGYDENDLDHCRTSGVGVGPSTGQDDDDPIYWDTHSATVDALFQAQAFDFSNPVSSAADPNVFKFTYGDLTGLTLSDYFAAIPDASGFIASDPGQSTSSFDNGEKSTMVDQDTLLRTLREAGYGYAEIADEMHERLGIKITANALVKRYSKMPKTAERLVAEALTNSMPKIMQEVYAALPYLNDGSLSKKEKETLDQLVQELPQILPKCIRGKLSRRRRATQPSASL